jgi:3-phenylpropionate/trans-cinnamate dioxygenase ferredoxin reductase subunit
MVIVGAGECGTRAAFALREAGYDGSVTLIGKEPHRPYERPPLSKPSTGEVTPKLIATEERFADADITLVTGDPVMSLDAAAKSVRLQSDRTIPYAKLLLATGTQPRALPVEGGDHAMTFRTLDDARAIFKAAETAGSAVLIGAGLIGLELASALRDRDIGVTVFEVADRALGRAVPSELAEIIVAKHRDMGVTFRFGTGIDKVGPSSVTLADGTEVGGDLIVAAIGVIPDTALAEAAGLDVGNGIKVDDRLRTSAPDIFSAGDCASALHPFYGQHMRFESWRNAQDQGEAAARNMAGEDNAFSRVPWFWSDQYDLGLQITGLPDPAHRVVIRQLPDDARLLFHLADNGRLMAASGIGTGNAVAKDIRLAEMLIEKGLSPDADALSDPAVNLKKLLRG